MDSNWDEWRPRKNLRMYGRLIVCTRVPACKSSALATALPNPEQKARLHYTRSTRCPTQLDQFIALGKKMWEEWKNFFFFYTQTHFRNPFIYRITWEKYRSVFIKKQILGFLQVKFKNLRIVLENIELWKIFSMIIELILP